MPGKKDIPRISAKSSAKDIQKFRKEVIAISKLPVTERLEALPDLYRKGRFYVYKHCRRWSNFAVELGITPFKINPITTAFGSKQRTLEAYLEVKHAGYDEEWVKGHCHPLWNCIYKNFGSFDAADEALESFKPPGKGPFDSRIRYIETSDENEKYQQQNEAEYTSKDDVIHAIKQLRKKREPLNISAVKRRYPKLMSFVYDQKPFWGWRQALSDAGISYDEISIELLSNIACKKCGDEFKQLQMHLRCKHDIRVDEYRGEFGKTEPVLSEQQYYSRQKSTGMNRACVYPHWEPLYTLEYVLDRLHYYQSLEMPLHRRGVVTYDAGLVGTIYDFHVSWDEVITLVGLDPAHIRKLTHTHWSKKFIVECLKQRDKMNVSLNPKALRGDNEMLYLAIRRHFDHYDDALRAAGIDPDKVRKSHARFTQEDYDDMVSEFKKIVLLPFLQRSCELKPLLKKYHNCCKKFHRNWERFAEHNDIPLWKIYSHGAHFYSRGETLSALGELDVSQRKSKWLDLHYGSLYKAIHKYFGSLKAALEALDF